MAERAQQERQALAEALKSEDPDGKKRQRAQDAFRELHSALDDLPEAPAIQALQRAVDTAYELFLYEVKHL